MSNTPQLTRVRASPGRYLFGAWQNVVITIWLTPADGSDVQEMGRFSDEVGRQWPTYSSVHIIEEGGGMPTKEGRDTLINRARSKQDRLAYVAALLPEASLMASLMSAFVRGIRTLTRGAVDIGIEQKVESLSAWLAPRHSGRTGVLITVRQLTELIGEARAQAVLQR